MWSYWKIKWLTKCALVTLWPTLIPKTVLNHQIFTTKHSLPKQLLFDCTLFPILKTLMKCTLENDVLYDNDVYKKIDLFESVTNIDLLKS